MTLRNTPGTYGLVAQSLHWLTALLILTLLPLGLFMVDQPQATEAEIASKVWLFSLHKTLGVAALVVAIIRILWALSNPKPVLLNLEHKQEAFAAETVHWALYGAILATPAVGLIHHWALDGFAPIWWGVPDSVAFVPKSVWLAELMGLMHWALAIVMMVSIAAHVGGALKHAVIDQDSTLKRIIPGAYSDRPVSEGAPPSHLLTFLAAGVVHCSIIAFVVVPFFSKQAPATPQLAAVEQVDGSWVVDHGVSRIGVVVQQMGAPVTGTFGEWTGDIRFDPDDLGASKAVVTINAGSFEIGAVTAQALGKDFLDVAAFPTASFETMAFRQTGEGTYEADSLVTLKGQTAETVFTFKAAVADGRLTLTGSTRLQRLAFNIGNSVKDEATLAGAVEVTVELEASR
ncbi:MAG: cytochrome b/b6 domain-containing protein [Magnetovibrionaceae bacterium]